MKFLPFALCVLIVCEMSCQNNSPENELVRFYIIENAHDPSKYELIELSLDRTITVKESFECHIESYKEKILDIEKDIERMRRLMDGSFSLYDQEDIDEKQTDLEKKRKMLSGTTKLMSLLSDNMDDILIHTYYHKYRAVNALGASMLFEAYPEMNNDFTKMVNYAMKYEDRLRCPRFPGYYKLLNRIYDY